MAETLATFHADYVEKRSRLSTFFRALLAIPHAIVLYVWGIVAGIAIVIAWFALLFTARYPRGLFDFVAAFVRFSTAFYAYLYLLTDRFPPFSGDTRDYPVRLEIGPPQDHYDRVKVLFRIVLAIPVAIVLYVMQIIAQLGALFAWFAIVILGRQPKGLQDMIVLGTSYQQRATAYLALLTERWPAFTDEPPTLEPPPAPRRSSRRCRRLRCPSAPDPSPRRLRAPVQARVGVFGGLELAERLRHGPAAGRAVDGHHGPALAVLVAEVHEQGVAVVLDAQPVGGIGSLVQHARPLLGAVGDERGPARALGARRM